MAATELRSVSSELRPIDTVPSDLHSYMLLRSTGLDDVRANSGTLVQALDERIAVETIKPSQDIPGGQWLARGKVHNPADHSALDARRAMILHRQLDDRTKFGSFLRANPDMAGPDRQTDKDRTPLLPFTDRFVVISVKHAQVAEISRLAVQGLDEYAAKQKKAELKAIWQNIGQDFVECLDALRANRRNDVRRMRYGLKVVFTCMSVAELVYWNQIERMLYTARSEFIAQRR